MFFDFNNNIDIIYAIDYFIKKDLNKMEEYNPKTIKIDLTELYNIYKKISEAEKNKIFKIGSFANKARYVLNNDLKINELELFNKYFDNFNIRKKIKEDILSNKGLSILDLDYLESFYQKKIKGNLIIYMTPFVSGAFGLQKDNTYYIILGVKYNEEKQKFTSCGTLLPKIIHELSHPIVNEKIKNMKLKIQEDSLSYNYYDDNKIEELLVRVLEVYNARVFLGNDYLEWALNEQDQKRFKNVRKIINFIDKSKDRPCNIDDFINILLKNNIIKES